MKISLRLLIVLLRALMRPRRALADVSRIPMRVGLADLDLNGHMNNGTYLTLQDLGRVDYLVRTGLFSRMNEQKWNAVVVAQTITYRAPLNPGRRFLIETRYLGYDAYGIYMEQRFTVNGQVHTRSYVKARITSATGSVPVDELTAVVPEMLHLPDRVPAWVRAWADEVRLPSSRSDAPSVWGRLEGDADGGASGARAARA
ncbi:MAG: acyl-CoA thioesterase [Pseudoclavibacter sp.]